MNVVNVTTKYYNVAGLNIPYYTNIKIYKFAAMPNIC